MPLVTDNIFEARAAYAALEARVLAAEQRAAALQTSVDALAALPAILAERSRLLKEVAVREIQANAQLIAQQAGLVSPDASLDGFIGSLGLAAALGEASMPDRAVTSVSAIVQGYLTYSTASDGTSSVGVRLYQPELGGPTALATTSFEISKVPSQPGTPAPRSLYAVLQAKQSVFTDPFWARFVTGTPPVAPAPQIVVEISKIFASVGAWSFPFLVGEAATIAGLETTLSSLISGAAPAGRVTAFSVAVEALSTLTKALDPAARTSFVAGDLFALAAALDATTRVADIIRS